MFHISVRVLLVPSFALLVLVAAGSPVSEGFAGSPGSTINVNTTDDNSVDGLCFLTEAIEAANTNAAVDGCAAGTGDDTINVQAGTYVVNSALNVYTDMQINGAGAGSTVLSGDDNNRVFSIGTKGFLTVSIADLTVRDGYEGDGSGGGIRSSFTDLTLTNVLVTANEANGTGGGIDNNGGTLNLVNSVVSDNVATDKGGGIYHDGDVKANVSLTVIDSTISGNTAPKGAGILNSSGVVEIGGSTFSGNDASQQGGALLNTGESMTIVNSTISGNTAGSNGGGGIFNREPVTLTNVTLTGNTATGGGEGINNDSETNLQNSIISGNGATNCGGSTPATSLGHNLEDTDTCNLTATGDQPDTGPMLGALAANGGPTQTHALLAGSPAIDTADDVGCPATDQRAIARPQDGDDNGSAICDIGAYEVEAAVEPPPPGEDTIEGEVSDPTPDPGDTVDVTVTVLDENGDPVVGVECAFSIITQPGDDAALGSPTATTDENGNATVPLDVGSTPGLVEVEADCEGLTEVLAVNVGGTVLAPETGGAPTNGAPAGAIALAVLLATVGGASVYWARRRSV